MINERIRKNVKKSMKKTASFLLAASVVFAVAGCGENGGARVPGTGGDTAGTQKDEGAQASGGENGGGDAPAAMGRYVEEETDLSEQSFRPIDLCRRQDGSLVIMDSSMGMLISKDQGAIWNVETPDWFKAIEQDGAYISGMYMAPDGTVAVLEGYSSDGDTNSLDYRETLELVSPDGTRIPVDLPVAEDELYIRQAVARDGGGFFVSTHQAVYEVEPDGSSDRVLEMENMPSWIWSRDNLLFIDNDWQEEKMPVIYDLEKGEYVEDEVLVDFVEDSYQNRGFNGSDYCDMYLMPGEDGTVYLAGAKGIHRHVIGGNMMEQIVDGNLSMLSNPQYKIVDMIQPEKDVFLVLFSNGRLIRFTYDPDIPSVPENVLSIYSLREEPNIRQAVSRYQTEHPDVFVSYKIGMGDDDSVTREDAIKKLNTEIMAGTGPDLLVMDNLPFDSYVEKGMLLDLTDYLAQYSAKEPLFDNVIEALKKGGKAYVAPATVAIPQVASYEEGAENMIDMSGIADAVERLRQGHPAEDIISIHGERNVMKRFAATSEPGWVTPEGNIDKENIKEYLEQCKRIYDAQMDGLDEEIRAYNEGRAERMDELWGMPLDEKDYETYMDTIDYIAGGQYLMAGWVRSVYGYLQMTSLDRVKGLEGTKVLPMQGRCSKVFKPESMLGISAASGEADRAKEFMDAFLSAGIQGEFDGIPLNQDGFDIYFTPEEEYFGEDGGYLSSVTTDSDGNMISYSTYWPSDEMLAAFKEEISMLSTAYIPDLMLEDAVFTQGTDYMRGDKTMEDALSQIERAVAIYMAE